jgi:DNA-directed RNA polymerase subunit RPC12/RpoP
MMDCQRCGQRSDWIGTESNWTAVHERTTVHRLYECNDCGHRQRTR